MAGPTIYPGEDEMLAVLDVLALTDDAMFVIDDRHRIVFWNRPIQRLLGYTHDEVAGRSCSAVMAGTDPFGNRYCSETCPVQLIARRGEAVRQFRLRFRSKDGPFVPLDVTVLKFTLQKSRRVLLAHLVRDAEQQLAIPAEPPQHVETTTHADARVRQLTVREIEILGLLAGGNHARDIAIHLGISPLTARNHIGHIFEKIEVHSQSEAVAFAYRMGLV